jgi:hypothetical protein
MERTRFGRSGAKTARTQKKLGKKFREQYEWKSHIINGVDFGEWVRKDFG